MATCGFTARGTHWMELFKYYVMERISWSQFYKILFQDTKDRWEQLPLQKELDSFHWTILNNITSLGLATTNDGMQYLVVIT
jgi:hypothetical protein